MTVTNAATQDASSSAEAGPIESEFDFDVFISYRRLDGSSVARWLRARLERYRLPPTLDSARKPIKTYLDTAFERATEDFWNQNIEPALRRSRFLLVVVTPSVFEPRANGEASWVEREIRLFLSLGTGRNVVVVTAAGNPLDRLPELLRVEFPRMDVVDLNQFGRAWTPGRRAALHDRVLTLIARIYAVSDTDMPLLRQEEERRKRKLAMRFTAAALSMVAILSVLLIFAVVGWTRATHERTAAEARSLGLAALRDFDSGRHIQAAFEAVEGGRKLLTLAPAGAKLDEYPTVAPLLALNRVLQGIRERNRKEHIEDSIRLQQQPTSVDTSRCAMKQDFDDARLATLMGHHGRILAKGCTPDGRFLVTTATDGTVRVAELSGSHGPEPNQLQDSTVTDSLSSQLVGLQGAARFLSFSPDSIHFRTTDVWGTVVEWDLSGASRALRATLRGHRSTVRAISFSPDGARVATGSIDGEVRTWSAKGEPLETTSSGKEAVVAVWLGEHGKRGLAVNAGGLVEGWQQDAAAPSQRGAVGGIVIDAAIGSDGQQIGFAIAGGAASFLDLRTGKSSSIRGAHRGWIMGVAFPPQANVIATAGADDTVGLHQPSGEDFGAPIRAQQGQVMGVAFSPDGGVLATAGEDGTVKQWRLAGTRAGQLIGHEGKVLAVRYSPDGRFIASAGADGTIRLWLRNGEQLSQWSGQAGFLAEEGLGASFGTAGISFGPDSRSVAIAASGGEVRIYRIQSLNELLDDACAWLEQYLASHVDTANVCTR